MATKPLFGDPVSEAPVWSDYAVLLADLAATVPTGTPTAGLIGSAGFTLNDPDATTPVTDEWDPVGALAADSPISTETETVQVTNHTAAGSHGVYAKTKNQREFTITFTAKELTLVTLGIRYDASGVTETAGNIAGTLKARDLNKKYLVGLVRKAGTTLERRVSNNYMTIDSITPDDSNDESNMTVTGTIFLGEAQELWDYYYGADQ